MTQMATTTAEKWLYAVLSTDAQLIAAVAGRIYGDQAPQDVAFPYIIFTYQGGSDVSVVEGVRIMVHAVYQVKAVDRAESYDRIDDIAARIDTLLHRSSGAPAGGIVLSCMREQIVKYPQLDGGTQYKHLGGLYRLIAQ